MSFRSIGDITTAMNEGKVRTYSSTKAVSVLPPNGVWTDLSMSPGNPLPKYWFDSTPLIAKAVYQSTDGGLYHGADVTPSRKYLKKLIGRVQSGTGGTSTIPTNLYILDYLIYYPTIDDGITDPQIMNNTITLPRYTDGVGVQMMAVTTGARTGGQTFTISYTNSDGVAGRTTPLCTQNADTIIGTITTNGNLLPNGAGPFIPLQDGDKGVRSIESITMNTPDSGLFSLLLVKPIVFFSIGTKGITSGPVIALPTEKDLLIHELTLPRIYDDAYLNCIYNHAGIGTGIQNVYLDLQIIWE